MFFKFPVSFLVKITEKPEENTTIGQADPVSVTSYRTFRLSVLYISVYARVPDKTASQKKKR